MEVYEKINLMLKEKNLTKRAFSNSLISLNPRLRITGETPSENTIYSYLSGRITIPIELIPYIAEVLNITEQELFDTSPKSRKKCFKFFLEDASKDELEYFNNFINYQIQNNVNVNYGSIIMNSKNIDDELEEFVKLLEYAPKNFLKTKTLYNIKNYFTYKISIKL